MNTSINKILASILVFFYCAIGYSQHDALYKKYGNVANFFGSAEEMKAFFNFKNGDVVAEVGAGKGYNVGGFGLLSDSCVFYIQDVDPRVTNKSNWNRVYRKCKKAGMSSRHQFHLVIGEYEKTLLPEAGFDKIIMVCSFHEFSMKKEMITDIKSRLKPKGMVYVLESKCYVHPYFPPDDVIAMWKEQGFELKHRDETNRNESEGLYILSFQQ